MRVSAFRSLSMTRIDRPEALRLLDRAIDLGAHQRREPLGGLVQDQQARVGHQRATDGEHLLLAARKLAAEVALPLRELREQRVHALERPRRRARSPGRGRDEVLAHGEVGEDLPPFGHQPEPRLRDAIRGQPVQRLALETDRPGAAARHAHDRAHRRRLAHAVAPEQRHDLARAHRERDAEQHLAAPVGGLEALDFERHAGTSSPR